MLQNIFWKRVLEIRVLKTGLLLLKLVLKLLLKMV